MKKFARWRKGFTMIEVLVVIGIIAIIAAIALPRLLISETEAKKKACRANVAQINASIELYHWKENIYPMLAVLFADVNYFPDGVVVNPVDGSSFVINSITNRVGIPANCQ